MVKKRKLYINGIEWHGLIIESDSAFTINKAEIQFFDGCTLFRNKESSLMLDKGNFKDVFKGNQFLIFILLIYLFPVFF